MLVQNQCGRQFECSQEDYDSLSKSGVKLLIIKNDSAEAKQEQSSPARWGIYLKREESGEENCASDRIRGEWVAKADRDFEIWKSGANYEAIVFHTYTDKIFSYGGTKILDMCDPVWTQDSSYKKAMDAVDYITVPTEGLKKMVTPLTKTPVCVIKDGHYFPHYDSRKENKHEFPAKSVVWFGYSSNFECVRPYLKKIKELALRLVVISDKKPNNVSCQYIPWDVKTYIEDISKCDFAILPLNKEYKSDNKDITAMMCGIPVAKTGEDIKRLIDPLERNIALQRDLSEYDVTNSAKEYRRLILTKVPDCVIYTAICGGYDPPRNDIKCFVDYPHNKFIQPVMNAKLYKVLPHKFFDTKYSVWVDGNIYPRKSNVEILKLLGNNDIAIFSHPERKSVYEEYQHAKRRLEDKYKPLIDEQFEAYKKEGMDKDFPFGECGVILRKHSPVVEEFNLRWWAEICRYCNRDQMSFQYVAWKMRNRIKIKILDGTMRNRPCFKYITR